MDGPAVTAPQDRELDAATINVCVGLLMEEASRLDASAWSMHSTGAFEAAAREQDECALRFRRMARELSALRPAPAVEKPTPTYAGYSIVADENWLGPGMIGVKQPAPAAPEGERVSWYSCSTCKGLHAHGEACPLIERPVSPASSNGEKPMSDEEIIRELGAAFLGISADQQPPFSECGPVKAAGWLRVLAKARKLIGDDLRATIRHLVDERNRWPADIREAVELKQNTEQLLQAECKTNRTLLAERNALAQENVKLKLALGQAQHDRDAALAKIDGAFAALRAK